MRSALIVGFLFSWPALADDDLTPDKAAKIERDKSKAMDAIDKKYGNKKPNELSSDERKAIAQERSAAEHQALEKNGSSEKAYTRYQSKMSKEERAASKNAGEKLEANEKAADAQAKEKAKGGPKEITIQRGFSDTNPVVLEEKAGGSPVVEKGLPQDYKDDQSAAGGAADPVYPQPAKTKAKKK
jgi:hypothetical protein